MQSQDLVKIANAINNQLADIVEIVLLQADEIHKMQIGRDIYIFSEDLQNIIYIEI